MRRLALLAVVALTGCASVQYAGSASYTVKPFVVDAASGKAICCEVAIADGKERESLKLDVERKGDDFRIHLEEQGIRAFQGQAVAAGAVQSSVTTAASAAVAGAVAPILPMVLP